MPIFEWDENKNTSNKKKHRVSFEDATDVFNDKDRSSTFKRKPAKRGI
jgi:hypothetical protein